MNLRSVIRILGYLVAFLGIIILIPLALAVHYDESESAEAFLVTFIVMILFSILCLIFTPRLGELRIGSKEGMLIVTLTWVIMTAFGALPLYLTDSMRDYSACYFEIMSGFTTTGATAMPDIEIMTRSILFWRNITNWLGGMGVVVLFVAILPIFGVKGNALVGAESVGPTKSKLTPTIQKTAMILWGIYLGISLLQVVFLLFGGLSVFDAFLVMFGTMGAAGFVPYNASIAAFDSAYVEWVCIIFMIIAGGNFSLYFYLLAGSARKVIRDGEFRLYLSIIGTLSLLAAIQLFARGIYTTFGESLRQAMFHIVSFITTTGFSADDYNAWPLFSQILILLTCFVGGCAGSAGGGIKVIRVGAMFRLAKNAIIQRIHPNAVCSVKIGKEQFSSTVVFQIAGFVAAYIATMLVGTLVIALTDVDFLTCFTSVILALGNIGIGLGGIGMSFTFDIYPDWALWVFSFLMLVGRLELFTVYSLFTRKFWKK